MSATYTREQGEVYAVRGPDGELLAITLSEAMAKLLVAALGADGGTP